MRQMTTIAVVTAALAGVLTVAGFAEQQTPAPEPGGKAPGAMRPGMMTGPMMSSEMMAQMNQMMQLCTQMMSQMSGQHQTPPPSQSPPAPAPRTN